MADRKVTAAMVAGGRTVGEPRLSPDGRTVAFVASGTRADLVVVPVEGGPELVLTTEPMPLRARSDSGGVFDWHPSGGALVYAAADGGVWLQPATGGAPRRLVAPHADGAAASPTVSADGAKLAHVVDTRHVAVTSLDGGWPQLTGRGADFALDPAWSPDGTLAWHEWDVPDMPWTGSRIATSADGVVVGEGGGVAAGQPRFSSTGALGWVDDSSGWANVRPLTPCLREHEDREHARPSWGPGIRTWCWSPDGSEVAVCRNEDGFGRLVLLPSGRELAKGWHHGLSWVGDRLVAVRTGARTPTQVVSYDVGTGDRTTLAHGPVAGWAAADLPEPALGRTDGGVPYRLYSPPRPARDRPPLLCWVHGGPNDQRLVAFNPRIAWWVDRGWAVLDVDHRGSTGHGRAWERAIHHGWGVVDVDDCAAAVRHVLDAGLADPDRVVATGSSAGGFTALLLLASHPELFRAGVALSAVTDLVDLAARSHRFERHSTLDLVGDHAAHVERSPLTHAEGIGAPVLLLHGDADAVVPVEQARVLAARLDRLERTVELHEYEGEGHGWSRPASVVDELERTEAFLGRHVLERL